MKVEGATLERGVCVRGRADGAEIQLDLVWPGHILRFLITPSSICFRQVGRGTFPSRGKIDSTLKARRNAVWRARRNGLKTLSKQRQLTRHLLSNLCKWAPNGEGERIKSVTEKWPADCQDAHRDRTRDKDQRETENPTRMNRQTQTDTETNTYTPTQERPSCA